MAYKKSNFSWDTETLVGVYEQTEKRHHEVKICTLKDVQYVSIAEKQLTDEGWKYKKNRTIPLDVFSNVERMLLDHFNLDDEGRLS